jgi:hypothetical protein
MVSGRPENHQNGSGVEWVIQMRADDDYLPTSRNHIGSSFEDFRDCQWYQVDLKITKFLTM